MIIPISACFIETSRLLGCRLKSQRLVGNVAKKDLELLAVSWVYFGNIELTKACQKTSGRDGQTLLSF